MASWVDLRRLGFGGVETARYAMQPTASDPARRMPRKSLMSIDVR
jgi:hypothetical protein